MSTAPRGSDEAASDRAKAASCRADHAGDFLLTMLWSADLIPAARADRAGIDRIGLDSKFWAKPSVSEGWGRFSHRIDQLRDMRSAVARAELFCRINPDQCGFPPRSTRF